MLTDRSGTRLFTSQRILLRLVDAETGVRGYAATGDRRFLEPYEIAIRVLPNLLIEIHAFGLRAPSAIRVESDAIAVAALGQIARLEDIAARIRKSGHVSEKALLAGKLGMDRVRTMIGHIEVTERAVNVARRARAERDRNNVTYAVAAAFVLAALGGIAAIMLFADRISARLRTVLAKTEALAANRKIGEPLAGNDEIAALDSAVHHMATAIRIRTDQIALANITLDEKNKETRAAYNELERFSYSVSHDLRTPVRAIGGFSRRLALEYGSALDAEGMRLLGVVQREAARMGNLIDDLLEFSRVGRHPLKNGFINMNNLVQEVSDLAIAAGATSASFVVAELPNARGDQGLVRLVWQNLIGNAIKYSGNKPAPMVSISGSIERGFAHYTIADNGVGFDMQYADKLFNVFERLHRSDEFPGTGVGLALVRRIVERHGGTVTVDAAVGRGATFSFSLPAGEGE